MKHRILCRIIVLTAVALVPVTASAAPTATSAAAPKVEKKLSASELVKSGEKKFHDGDAPGALADLEAALALPPKSQTEIDAIKKRIEEVRATPSHIHIETSPPGAVVSVDGKALSQWSPVDVALAPGHHVVHVVAHEREPQSREIDVAFATDQSVSFVLASPPPPEPPPEPAPVAVAPPPEPPPPPPAPPPPPDFWTRENVGIAAGALAIVSAGVGTGFGVAALKDKSAFQTAPTASLASEGNNFAVIADTCLGAAVVLAVTGAILYFTDDTRATPPLANSMRTTKTSAVRFVPSAFITSSGAGAGALVRF